jgi:hypothetical protein
MMLKANRPAPKAIAVSASTSPRRRTLQT